MVNNKGADQPAQLLRAFVILYLESIIVNFDMSAISTVYLVFVAEQTDFSFFGWK